MMDRFFDNYISTPQQKVVFDSIRDEAARDPQGVAEARAMLDTAYAWLDRVMAGRDWAAGERFQPRRLRRRAVPVLRRLDASDRSRRIAHVHAYRRRLLARPSFARAVDEARPYRHYFPLGAPDRD